eukprot:3915981-Rhodomonas_salina.1
MRTHTCAHTLARTPRGPELTWRERLAGAQGRDQGDRAAAGQWQAEEEHTKLMKKIREKKRREPAGNEGVDGGSSNGDGGGGVECMG